MTVRVFHEEFFFICELVVLHLMTAKKLWNIYINKDIKLNYINKDIKLNYVKFFKFSVYSSLVHPYLKLPITTNYQINGIKTLSILTT